ncbi:DgyrCDS11299 [Dimorphilus gyrociliatus]|uniref:DgyrCDS11299 n=1 Tax=Dimorphilus gyrociliatus TaxID=2664684 RepID=A0A7I8W3W3_9ANNE|nr:DgyrCDS11299 [Dimorphilus gyrociliatus]
MLAITFFALIVSASAFRELNGPIVSKFWDMMNKDPNGDVSDDQITEFFKRYERQEPSQYELEVDEQDFTSGTNNWMNDFEVNDEVTRAYFRVLSLDAATELLITERDTNIIAAWCDEEGRGLVNEAEWKTNFPGLLRAISWGVMFVRYDANKDEKIDRDEFNTIFRAWDSNGDGSVTLDEFTTFWTTGSYGSQTEAEKVHGALDFNSDGVINQDDVDTLYSLIDSNSDNLLEFDEWTTVK